MGGVVLAGGVVLVGCGTETGAQADSETFADQIAAAIEQAEAGGASEAQLAILRQAQIDGEVSLEDARATAHAVVECVNNAGFSSFYSEHTEGSGLVIPEYSYSSDPEQEAITDACMVQEDAWVSMVYQMQPSSQAREDAFLEQQAPLVRRCLETNGYTVAPNATTHEVLCQAVDAILETDGVVDCLVEAGIDGF